MKVKAIPDYQGDKLKGFIHWVSKEHSVDAIVRVYNYLFDVPEPNDDWFNQLNPDSLIEKKNAKVWTNIANSKEYDKF